MPQVWMGILVTENRKSDEMEGRSKRENRKSIGIITQEKPRTGKTKKESS